MSRETFVNDQSFSLLLAFGATLSFATSSLVYANYSRRVSVLWMNCFKSLVAFLALLVTIPLVTGWHRPSFLSLAGFLLSGFVGLNIGDLFLLSAFIRLGVARTLILFGFQPLFMGIAAFYLFDQAFRPERLVAVLFLIACLFTFSLERYRQHRRWELAGLFFALAGVSLDTCGILLTRGSFIASPDVTPIEGLLYRCAGALVGFGLISLVKPLPLTDGLRRWPWKTRLLLIGASLLGSYLSLMLYLTAVKIGHLASIAGVAITGPIFAAVLESLVQRRAPSRYLVVAFLFFLVGFSILWRAS